MTPGPNDVPDGAIRHFERGLEAYFATDTIADVLRAVDVRTLLSGEDLSEPIDYERMGKVVGSIVGRLVVRGTVGRYTPGQFAEQTIGYTVGGLVGRTAVRTLDPERLEPLVRATVRDLERRPLTGKRLSPSDRASTVTWTDIPIEGEEGGDGDEFEGDTIDDGSGRDTVDDEAGIDPTDDGVGTDSADDDHVRDDG